MNCNGAEWVRTSMVFLTVTDLSHHYGPTTVLDGVSLQVGPGDRLGLVGANGSGKSTLLRAMAGRLEADEGHVTRPAGVEIGYLPQEPPSAEGLTLDDLIRQSTGELRALEQRMQRLAAQLGELAGDALQTALTEYGEVAE